MKDSAIKIAVDNQISYQSIQSLNDRGFLVVQRAFDLPDEVWVIEALKKGAEFIVSPDLDVPNLLDRLNADAVWIDLKQGLKNKAQSVHIENKIKAILKQRSLNAMGIR